MKLIHGTFSPQDAQTLLQGLTTAKIAFHENKIRTVHLSEEDIKHSEQKIIQLGNNLRKMIADIKSHPGCNVAIDTDIAMTILSH